MNTTTRERNLVQDFLLPTLLFAAVGGMVWAVRGCSGFGAAAGCVFAGVTWGTAWWYIAREPGAVQSRRYTSGWIILALTVGIGYSGSRGWMQWPSFFEGKLLLDAGKQRFVPIPRTYGFIWLFIAGVPWAGLGACLLAWTGSARRLRAGEWALRIGCGVGTAALAVFVYKSLPGVFLPLYDSMRDKYGDFAANPNLKRLYGDNWLALMHLGLYLGFLLYEALRRDWKNVTLIATVGLVNGLGWSLLQNWRWAQHVWPQSDFNFWRCWESSGGISIGVAYGVAYFLVNRPDARVAAAPRPAGNPDHEVIGLWLGLVLGIGMSIKNGFKGWANIYIGNEHYWSNVGTAVMGPIMLALLGVVAWRLYGRAREERCGDLFPYANYVIWGVLIIQNAIAQAVTGPYTVWNEMAFKVYYVLLFFITAAIVCHYQYVKRAQCASALVANEI